MDFSVLKESCIRDIMTVHLHLTNCLVYQENLNADPLKAESVVMVIIKVIKLSVPKA